MVETRCVVLAASISLPWALPTTKAAVLWSLEEGPPASSEFWWGPRRL